MATAYPAVRIHRRPQRNNRSVFPAYVRSCRVEAAPAEDGPANQVRADAEHELLWASIGTFLMLAGVAEHIVWLRKRPSQIQLSDSVRFIMLDRGENCLLRNRLSGRRVRDNQDPILVRA